MSLSESILKMYLNSVFVETGTYRGNSVQVAKFVGFDQIISIEASKVLFDEVKVKFRLDPSIKLVCGDSSKVLWSVIEAIQDCITFFLDGHNLEFGLDTRVDKKGMKDWPLVDELKAIAKHPIKSHIILIDNVELFGQFGTSVREVENLLFQINSSYVISFISYPHRNSEIMVAEVR